MEIDPSLLGLNKYELLAYEALVKNGKSTATKISRASGVPHGKIYLVLDSLAKKGLIDIIPKEPKEFIPNNPKLLNSILEDRNKKIDNIKKKIEELNQFYRRDKEVYESNVIVREGKKAFYKIIENLKEPKYYNYSIKWSSGFHKDWAKKYKKQIENNIDIKVLTRYDEETKKDVNKYFKYNRNIKRFDNEGFALSVNDDEEVMIALIKSDSTLLIRDRAFAKALKKMFLETYENAEKIHSNSIDHKKTLKILRGAISSFEGIDNYKMISIIGSTNRKESKSSDLDLITFGDSRIHAKFKKHLFKTFAQNKIRISFFKTILKKSKCKKGFLLIHDLHYTNQGDLLKKEWKTVINAIKEESLVLYGENILDTIPLERIDRENFFSPYYKWVNQIKDVENYNVFETHLLNISHVFKKYEFNEEYDYIKSVADSQEEWDEKLKKIKSFFGKKFI